MGTRAARTHQALVISPDKRQEPPMWPLLVLPLLLAAAASVVAEPPPAPTDPWPEQYHAVVLTNLTDSGGRLRQIDIYYDWPHGRALNIVRDQLSGDLVWNVQWVNGTCYLWDAASCETFQFAVGLSPPDWKARGATYLGRELVDGFDCHVWSNFVFPRYFEDVATGRPVAWDPNVRPRQHILSFEAGAVAPDSSKWQAPAYCFNGGNADASASA